MIDKNNIPSSWEMVKLGDVCFTTSGGTPSRKVSKYYGGNIPWVKSGELDKGLILDTEEKITEEAIQDSSAKIFPKGTLLIALYGATIGKLAFLGVDASSNQAVCGIYKNEFIDSNFLYHFLFFRKNKLISQGIGGAQPNISQGILKDLDFPFPPLKEQKRIVGKIEELITDLDKGIEYLVTAQQQLRVYRHAVFKWAFEGKLTNSEKNISIVPFGTIIKVVSGNTPKGLDSISNTGEIQFYKVSDMNLIGNEVEMKTTKFHLSKSDVAKLKIKLYPRGTVIFPKRGGAILTNKKRILTNDSAFDLNLMGALPNEKVEGKYLFYWFQKLDLGKIYDGSNVPQINNKNIEPLKFPLCKISEQEKIVKEIESRLSVCDKIEEAIETSLLKAEALRLSIIKKGFEGKLVKQNPKDEPAQKLLERIRAEKKNGIKKALFDKE